MEARRVTQKDIAEALGLHRSTISLALRNHPSIPLSTRQQVAQTAQSMGYRPDPMLAALAAYRELNRPPDYEGTLAWLFSSKDGFDWKRPPLYRQYYEGACEQAQRRGYRLEVFDLNSPGMTTRRMTGIFLARNIQGVLLCPQPTDTGSVDMPWENFSAVTFGYTLKRPNLHKVTATQFRGISLILRNLRQMGYRRIGFAVSATTNQRTDNNYLAAFVTDEYLNGGHFAIPPLMIDHKQDVRALADWVRSNRIDVVVTSDHKTLGILREQGFEVPQSLGVASCCLETTDSEASGLCENSLQIGRTAVDAVVAMIHRGERGIPEHPQHLLVEGTWVQGKTLRKQTGEQPAQLGE